MNARATTPAKLTPASELIKSGVLTPTGLNMRKLGDLTYSRAEGLARFLGALRDASAWAMGDLLAYAEAAYGSDEMYQLAESTGRSPERLADYRRVSQNVAMQQRVLGLSWTHHRHVAKMAPDDQTYWLAQAEAHQWTSYELFEQIRKQRATNANGEREGGGGSGGAVVAQELETAAHALVRAGNPDGNGFILVPVDTWARFRGALGLED